MIDETTSDSARLRHRNIAEKYDFRHGERREYLATLFQLDAWLLGIAACWPPMVWPSSTYRPRDSSATWRPGAASTMQTTRLCAGPVSPGPTTIGSSISS